VTLNGRPILGAAVLQVGDEIHIGNTTLRVEAIFPETTGAGIAEELQSLPEEAPLSPAMGRGETVRKPVPPPPPSLLGSPLILGSAVALVVLLGAGLGLYVWYYGRTTSALFDRAQETMNEGRYLYARKLFEDFLESYPNHELAPLALIYRELCDVYSARGAGDDQKALEELVDFFDRVGRFPELKELLPQVGDVASQIVVGLAERAAAEGTRPLLDRAREAYGLWEQRIPEENRGQEKLAAMRAALEKAESAVVRQEAYEHTVAAMQAALREGKTEHVYRSRDRLLQVYPGYAPDQAIQKLLGEALQLDQRRCRWEKVSIAASEAPEAHLVQWWSPAAGGSPAEASASGPAVFALLDGVLYALDARTGIPLWRRFLGLDQRHLPVRVPAAGSARVCLVDVRQRQVLMVEELSGKVLWRLALPEPLYSPPLYHQGWLYLPTLEGNLYRIDSGQGSVIGRLHVGKQKLTLPPVPSVSGRYLYLLGEHSTIYVIALKPGSLEVASVFYSGHLPATFLAAPLRLHRYLVLCENLGTQSCFLRVFLATEGEESLVDLAQRWELSGWVHQTPAVRGNLLVVATDRDLLYVFSAGAPERKEGLKPVAEARPETVRPPLGQAYALPLGDTETLLVAGSTIRTYRLSLERQTLRPVETLPVPPGAAAQPIQSVEDGAVVCWRSEAEPSLRVIACQLAGSQLQRRWETLVALGCAELHKETTAHGAERLVLLAASGHWFVIEPKELTEGNRFLRQPLGKVAPEIGFQRAIRSLTLPQGPVLYVPADGAANLLVRPDPNSPAFTSLPLPAGIEAGPVALAEGIVVGTRDGRIHWLSPQDGSALAEPFQPPLEEAQRARWTGLVALGSDRVLATDSLGRVFLLEPRSEKLQDQEVRVLAAVAEGGLSHPVSGSLVALNSSVAYVSDHLLQFLDVGELHVKQEHRLPPPLSLFPLGAQLLVLAGDGRLYCFDATGQRLWQSAEPLKSPVVGRPLLEETSLLHVASQDGILVTFRLEDGTVVERQDLGEPLGGGPVRIGQRLVVPARDGTLLVLPLGGGTSKAP
jgi:outer membrane protein assembly factor BamB